MCSFVHLPHDTLNTQFKNNIRLYFEIYRHFQIYATCTIAHHTLQYWAEKSNVFRRKIHCHFQWIREKSCPVSFMIGCDDRTRFKRHLEVIACLNNELQGKTFTCCIAANRF